MKPARLVSTLMPASLPFADGGGGSRNPNAASPNPSSPTTTRAMVLEGSLEFGTVQIGSASERRFRIYNNGNAVMTVTALTVPTGCEFFVDWQGGDIQPGTSRVVTMSFRPSAVGRCGGMLAVEANHTSGTNTLPISARGDAPLWSEDGVGNGTFSIPSHVTRIKTVSNYPARSESFIVRLNENVIVKELMGTLPGVTRFQDVRSIAAGQVTISSSDGVTWSFEEIR